MQSCNQGSISQDSRISRQVAGSLRIIFAAQRRKVLAVTLLGNLLET